MPANDRPPLYRWMDAWMGPDGPAPTTRHVLHALASHMDRFGDDCWPGTRLLAEETGLARKTVRRHLDLAKDAGWISWVEEAGEGQAWRRRLYSPTYPSNMGESEPPTSTVGEAGESGSSTSDRKVGDLRVQGGGTEGGKVGDSGSPRVHKRHPGGTHVEGVHPRENGDGGGQGHPAGRECPSCGETTMMPEGVCPSCRMLAAPAGQDADGVSNLEFPDPGDIVRLGPNYPTSPDHERRL